MKLADLKALATELKIAGRSKMNKAELIVAIGDVFIAEAIEMNDAITPAKSDEWIAIKADGTVTPVKTVDDWMPRKAANAPLTSYERELNYRKQNDGSYKLTAKQRRRVKQKDRRNIPV